MSQILVGGVPPISSLALGKSIARDSAYAAAVLAAFNRPYEYHSLDDLAQAIYAQYAGPDLPTNTTAVSKDQIVQFYVQNAIPFHDLAPVIALGDPNVLRAEMASMNRSGIPVLLFLENGQGLKTADGLPLHPFQTAAAQASIIRLGFQTDQPVTLIADPAAPVPPLPYPIPANWDTIVSSQIVSAIGVMPAGIPAPAPDFRFWQADGSDTGKDIQWPQPAPQANIADAIDTIQALQAAIQAEQQRSAQLWEAQNAGFLKLLADLGYHPQ
jgi:hypothetical protein